MHSRIFQVSKKPIERKEYLDAGYYDYDHWFTREVADYVSSDCNRAEDIKWLQNCVDGITFGKDENGEYFIIESKVKYFEDAFKKFAELLNNINKCTVEDFAKGIQEVWIMRNVYEDKFGFYVDINDELMPFDHFVRLYNEKEKYYIGGTIDYHC